MKPFNMIVGLLLALTIATEAKAGLPVVISRAQMDNKAQLVLFISGDGGWNSFSKHMAASYNAEGFDVIGLNSFKYFWKKKTPIEAASDIAELLNTYLSEWHKQQIIICGFSFGADVTPFIFQHLPETLKSKVSLVQLISPSAYTDFEIHVMDMLGSNDRVRAMNIATAVAQLDVPVTCFYGAEETEKPLAAVKKTNLKLIVLPGDHHYAKSYMEIPKNAVSL